MLVVSLGNEEPRIRNHSGGSWGELHFDLWQQGFDFGLGFGGVAILAVNEFQHFEEGEVLEHGQSLIRKRDVVEFEAFELRQTGDRLQLGIRHLRHVGHRDAAQRGNAFDYRDRCSRCEIVAELQKLQRQFRNMNQRLGRGFHIWLRNGSANEQ
jgi:hypothetical protein